MRRRFVHFAATGVLVLGVVFLGAGSAAATPDGTPQCRDLPGVALAHLPANGDRNIGGRCQ